MSVRVGLTGGVASGKSTVAAVLARLGAVVIDADLLAREVVEPGTPGLQEVVEAFGAEVLAPDGTLDRPALGAIVFTDEERRRALEAIIHPRVRELGMSREAAAGSDDVVVHDIPLLVETGQADRFDAVVVVDVPEEMQVERLVTARGLTEEEARARIAAQASRAERLAAATYVIDNSGTLADLEASVQDVYRRLTASEAP